MPRRSLGGSRFIKSISQSINPKSVSVERRWSLVGSSWSKPVTQTCYDSTADRHGLPPVENTQSKVESLVCKPSSRTTIYSISEDKVTVKNENITTSCVEKSFQIEKADTLSNANENLPNSIDKIPATPTTEQLVQRLGRQLHIRQGKETEPCTLIRSPSLRKIGTMRPHDKMCLKRTQTWHISSTSSKPNFQLASSYSARDADKTNVGLGTPIAELIDESGSKENWTPADCFFTPAKAQGQLLVNENLQFQTPKMAKRQTKTVLNNVVLTPMLPPSRLPPQKSARTPRTTQSAAKSTLKFEDHKVTLTPIADENGRASIARLRTQNAGMVMAKAKLFDGLVDATTSNDNKKRPMQKTAAKSNLRRREITKTTPSKPRKS